MSNDDDLEEYECQAAGHTSGSRSFYEPSGWSPTWCPGECRPWRKVQRDETYICDSCGLRFSVKADTKIYHYFNEGPWDDPTECDKCKRDGPPEKLVKKPLEEQFKEMQEAFRDRGPRLGYADPTSLHITSDPADIQHLIKTRDRTGVETRQAHLEAHVPGSLHYDSQRTPTTMGAGDRGEIKAVLRDIQALGKENDPRWALEKHEPDSRIVKVDIQTGDRLVFEPIPGNPDEYRPVTAYMIDPDKL